MLRLLLLAALQLLLAEGRGLSLRQRSLLQSAGFLRDSVESVPEHELPVDTERGGHRSSLRRPVFGSRALPLRAAVERTPSPWDRAHVRYPLRDAVERRPAPVDEVLRLRDPGVRPAPPAAPSRPAPAPAAPAAPAYQSPVMVFAPPAGWPHSIANPFLAASGMDWWRRRSPVLRIPPVSPAQHVILPPLQPQQRWGLIANPNYVFSSIRKEPAVMTYQAAQKEDSDQRKVVCYLEAWAAYRKDVVAYSASDVDPFACTHLIYAFASIDPHTFRMEPQDEEYDLVKGGYRSVVGLKRKNPNLKVMLSVGGWMEGSTKFSQMASQANRRREFIRSVVKAMDLYKFDGLDLDWEYPGALDLGGLASDKGHFSLLVDELSEVFRARGWLLSAAVSPSRFRIEDAYDIPRISQNLDFINLMSFDLHAERDSAADHHAPLHSRPHDASIDIFYNVDYAVKYWIKKGAPAEKLVLGVPFYGRSFTLRDTTQATPGSPIKGLGQEGRYTQEKGFLSYVEICELQSEGGWRLAVDRAGSPYMVKGDQWVGYEDPHSITIKMSYIRKQKLGGVMIWAIDLDDFKGLCGDKAPLLTAVRKNINEEQSVYAPTPAQAPGSLGSSAPLLTGKPTPAPVPASSPGPIEPVELNTEPSSTATPIPSSTPASTSAPPPEPGLAVSIDRNSTVCNGTGYAKDTVDCNVYHICDWNTKTTYVCPEPLHFNADLNLCDWPESAGCANKTEGSKAVNDEVAKVCELRGGAASDPDDCSRYYWCADGRAYRLRCSRGHYFHAVSGVCLPGSPRDICQDYHFPELQVAPTLQRHAAPSTKQLIGEDNYKVICYFTSWASYRKKEGKFVPEHMDPRLCTHIVYAFASLEPETLTIQPFDPWADIENNFYDRLTALPDPRHGRDDQLKVILSMGGWTDSAGDKYSELVSSDDNRRMFVQSAVAFLRRHNFKGLQIDWNYPKCWHSDCSKGPASDKPNFTKLIKDLHEAFMKESPPLVVAVGLSGYKDIIDNAYELRELSKYVEYFSVMSYDYHGSWEGKLGHVSPLYYRDGDRNPYYNTNSTLEYLVSKGAARQKLMAGIPFYGQSYTLKSKGSTALGDPSAGPGEAGELTSQPGMLAYYEICDRVRRKMWTVGKDSRGATGPFAFFDDQWVSYDDVSSVKAKAQFIKNMGFGGAVAWTVDLDDFGNRCCLEPFPLLRALNRVLGRLAEDEPTSGDCTKPPTPVTPASPTMTTAVDSGDGQYKPSTPSTTWPTWTEGSSTTSTTPSTTSWPSWKPPSSTEMSSTTTKKPSWETTSTVGLTTMTPSTTAKLPTTSSTEMPPVTIASPPPPVPPSAGRPPMAGDVCQGGEYIPDPTNCNAYYRCILGELKKQNCAAGLHWNSNSKVCDWPSDTSCPNGSDGQSTSSSTTTTMTAPTSASPSPSTSSSTTTTSTTPPSSSTSTTSTTPSTTMSSTTNEWWTHAPTTERPDQWWTHPTKSTTTQASTSSTTQKPQEPTTQPSQVECVNGQYSSHNTSCEKFYICVNGHQVEQHCASGLVWNSDTNMCDWKFNVKCRVEDDDLVVRGMEKKCSVGEFRSHENCGQYYMCVHGEMQAFSCAPGLQWDKDQQICNWPTDPECAGSIITETTSSSSVGSEQGEDTTSKPSTTTKNPWLWEPEIVTPKPIVDNEPLPPLSGHFKIVCYFTNWAWYRQGQGKYLPEHINPNLCTHIVYGFAVLDYENLVMKAHDSWADFDNKFYDRVVAFKKKGKKVSLALGGWNDSAGDKYSRLVNNPNARRRFIKHAIEFLDRYGFDGLDLDWEYPKCWQVNCEKGPDSDKAAFGAFVREIREAFAPRNLLLSSAVSPSKTVIDAGYDVPALADSLDWVAVMTYDFHGQWDKKTGHVAPMYFHPDDDFYFFNANFSINYWIEKGVPRRKIVMGMPLYGQSFQLAEASTNGLNARAPGPGQAGEFTRAAGFLAYYEICERVKNRGWTVVKDPEKRMGPYAFHGNQWVSYDDVDMIRLKSQYIRKNNLGGGMIWALDLDDFRNSCGEGIHPLLKTIRKELGPAPGSSEAMTTAAPPTEKPDKEPSSTTAETQTTAKPDAMEKPAGGETQPEGSQPSPGKPEGEGEGASENKPAAGDSEYKVVCYFTNWAWYRQGLGKYLPSDIDPALCTHVVYGFAVLDGDRLVIKPHDSWADLDNNFYEKVTALKKRGIKVTVAIGGWNDSAGDKYSRLANNPTARERFIKNVLEFIDKYNFDGLDLDWEYPKCWQVNCKQGPDSDKQGFAALVRELKEAFRPKGLLLSSAVSPNKAVIDAGYDVPVINENLDWIAVMAYDYHGQWDKQTGHVAPMYVHPDDVDATFNTNFTINYWLSQGADPKKLVLGMPMYGQSFSLADNSNHGLNAPTYGGGEAGDFTRARGFLSYYEICYFVQKKGWKVVRDPTGAMGPYAYLRDQWVSFDDIDMIRYKSEWIKKMGLGGGMIWALDLDDFTNRCHCETYPLLKTINRVLRGYSKPDPKCTLHKDKDSDRDGEDSNTVEGGVSVESAGVSAGQQCNGQQFKPHEGDCNKYYTCIFDKFELQSCPDKLYWSKDHCDWPENSHCTASSGPDKIPTTSEAPPSTTTPGTEMSTEVTTSQRPPATEKPPQPADKSGYKVVCYFTNWAWYRQGIGKYTPDDIDSDLCTHITYGFAVLDGSTLTIKPHDTWADIDNDFYSKVVAYKKKGIKVSIAIGGWNDSLGDKYSRLVNDPRARKKFIEHLVQFIEKYDFDGLDLDWEYPKCWQVNCNLGPESDKEGFASLVRELSAEFKPRNWLLSSAVSPSKLVIDQGYDVPTLSKHFDWIAVMTYDFHGHWDKQTGHVAPLYYVPGDTFDYFNANFTMHYWIAKGADPKKLVMGMPMYGQSFALADNNDRGLNAKSYGPGEAGEFTRAGGFLAYYEICDNVKRHGWTVVRDPEGRIGPYAYRDNQWVSYDDVDDIRRKSKFIKEMGLAGGMIWALDLDDFTNRCGCGQHPLLKTINQELRGLSYSTINCT